MTTDQITIPPEVVEAAAREQALRDNVDWSTLNALAIKLRCDDARAAITAALAAWPGAFPSFEYVGETVMHTIILPYKPQENIDDPHMDRRLEEGLMTWDIPTQENSNDR